jgi:hypothetical protein
MNSKTLYLSTPSRKEKQGSTKFEKTKLTGIGSKFWIKATSVKKLSKGMPVVVLRRDVNKSRAEGVLIKWVQSGLTRHDPPQPRYDLFVDQFIKVEPYVRPALIGTFRDDGGGVLIE